MKRMILSKIICLLFVSALSAGILSAGAIPVYAEKTPVQVSLRAPAISFPGDVDKDNKLSAIDAMLALQLASKITPVVAHSKANANVNGDAKINAIDAMMILQKSFGMNVTLLQAPNGQDWDDDDFDDDDDEWTPPKPIW